VTIEEREFGALAERINVLSDEVKGLRNFRHDVSTKLQPYERLLTLLDNIRTELDAMSEDVAGLMAAARESKGAKSVVVVIAERVWPIIAGLVGAWVWLKIGGK
jgi:hypothetical protein